ncbi:MAG: hemolysin III family protein [Acidimicrobiia bacterium]
MRPHELLEPHQRVTLGKMTQPVRGFLHGGAAVASLIGLAVLLVQARGELGRGLAVLVFGLSLVALYTVSALYHSIPWGQVWKKRMQRLDHSMIYVLVAGTYTPIGVIVFHGWLRWGTLAAQWGIVTVGIAQKAFFPGFRNWLAVALPTTQGWLALFLLVPLARHLPWTAILLLLAGGVAYTVGMVLLVTGHPRLWPRAFSYHEVFHLLVVAGSGLHFATTLRYVVPFAQG